MVAANKKATEPRSSILNMKLSRREFYGYLLTWLVEYMCDKWPRIWIACRNCNPILWPCILYHGVYSKRKRQMIENDLLKTTQKIKYHTTRTPLKPRCLFMCTIWISISCCTSGICRATQGTNPVISHIYMWKA